MVFHLSEAALKRPVIGQMPLTNATQLNAHCSGISLEAERRALRETHLRRRFGPRLQPLAPHALWAWRLEVVFHLAEAALKLPVIGQMPLTKATQLNAHRAGISVEAERPLRETHLRRYRLQHPLSDEPT